MMHRGPANKKLRLDTSNRQKRNSPLTPFSDNGKDAGLWGDEFNLDDEVMQQIESQALSQCQENLPQTSYNYVNQSQLFKTNTKNDNNNIEELRLQLQAKQGEVTNLRLEKDHIRKDFQNQLNTKEDTIEQLKKQLSEKQSELEFQKMEKLSQTCRTPRSVKVQNNVNSPFSERFPFTQSKNSANSGKIFNFGGQLNKGDVLYKLLNSSFLIDSKNKTVPDQQIENENEFTLYLNCCLLQLCRYASFEKTNALDLIKLIVSRSHELLLRFLTKLSAKEVKPEPISKKSKVITLPRVEDDSFQMNNKYQLLSNTKWFSNEKGIAVRQTVTMLAKLMMIEPLIIHMLVECDLSSENWQKCRCVDRTKSTSGTMRGQHSDVLGNTRPNLITNEDLEDLSLYASSKKVSLIFDIIEVFEKIVQEIFIRKSHKYEGIFSSIMYFCSVLCNNNENVISEKHKECIMNIFQKILFSLPGFIVIRYMVEFLSTSTQYNFSDALCHRSAAETFSENFRSFCFTEDTCMLQVLCAYIEMIHKSPNFLDKFTSWVLRMATGTHVIKWMNNETNSRLCECLPTLEQIFIRIMLHCIEDHSQKDLTIAKKLIFDTSVKRCITIFKQFRWQDCQFSIHIANCQQEYKMLLSHLAEISEDEADNKFISKEKDLLAENTYKLSQETCSELIASMTLSHHFSLSPIDDL